MREKQKKMDKEINLKGKKGITLIALTIMIIVILILARSSNCNVNRE